MNKTTVRNTMLSLEEDSLAHAKQGYADYLKSAMIDRTESIESDETAQAETASDLAEAFDQPVHTHTDKIAKLTAIDFGRKIEVEEGAIVKFSDRYFVISVSTARFECDGESYIGISPQAPIYQAMQGKRTGETFAYGDRQFDIQALF